MEDDGKNFYLLDRMAHHTVDVTNDESFEMVKGISTVSASLLFFSSVSNIDGVINLEILKIKSY